MVGVASSDRVVFQGPEPLGKGDMLSFADHLISQEQHLVLQKCVPDRLEEVVVRNCLGKVDPDELGADVCREFFDAHQITNIDDPVVFPASMSSCARTASSSS